MKTRVDLYKKINMYSTLKAYPNYLFHIQRTNVGDVV